MQKSSPRWRDFPAITLLVIVVFIASARLVFTHWTEDLYITERITVWGLLLGSALGYSVFRKFGVVLLTFLYSLVVIPWQILATFSSEFPVVERISQLSERLVLTRELYIAQEAVEDPLVFIVIMSLFFWVVAVYSSFALLRTQNTLASLLPSTLAILAIQYYDNRGASLLWMIGFYFFFALLFLSRLDYKENSTRWLKEKVFVVPDTKIDISIITSLSFAFLLLFVWNIPSTRAQWTSLSRWWQKTSHRFTVTSQNIENLFSGVDNPRQISSGSVFYGSELSLGERSYLGEEEIVIVDVPELENPPPRYYWRVRSYDIYRNGSWASSPNQSLESYDTQTALPLPYFPNSTLTEFAFTSKTELRINLITAQQPLLADIELEALYTPLPDGTLDLNLLRAKEEILADTRYTIQSALTAPTVREMREAGTEYPDWVTDRYLQLPSDLPESIAALSRELASGRATPYDKARAITNYLRAEITYSEQVPAPPEGRDALEWFIFTWKEGYCNYAATAEVVLLRAAGVPARMVVGFAQGQRTQSGNYRVLRKDAHAWAEVYFPEIGWVEFEPTLNQPRLLRPSGEVISEEEEEDMLELRKLLDEEEPENIPEPEEKEPVLPDDVEVKPKVRIGNFLVWGMIVLLTGTAFVGLWYFNREQVYVTRGLRFVVQFYEKNDLVAPLWITRWLSRSETNPIARAFYSVNTCLRWLGEEIPAHYSPKERASTLIRLLPKNEEDINILLAEHQKAIYTPSEGDLKIAQSARRKILWQAFKKKVTVRKDHE